MFARYEISLRARTQHIVEREREDRMKLRLDIKMTLALVSAALIVMPLIGVQSVGAQTLDGTLKRIKDSGTMNLGYLADASPFSSLGPDKKPMGYSVELCTRIANAIQKQLNVTLKQNWVAVTVENRISMVEQGKVDLECSTTTATISRSEKVDFSLMTYVDGAALLTVNTSRLRSLTDVAGKKIAVIKGTTTETSLNKFLKDQVITTVKITPVKDRIEGRTALENGTVDAFASDQAVLIGLALTAKDPKRFVMVDGLFSYEPYAFMMRRNDAAFRASVNRVLAALYRSGDVLPIYNKWFGTLGKVSEPTQLMYMVNGLPE
jgi:glutamate/aspartate transport system substrate-binding protein